MTVTYCLLILWARFILFFIFLFFIFSVEISTSKGTIEGLFVQARTVSFPNATSSFGEFRSYAKYTAPYNCFGGSKVRSLDMPTKDVLYTVGNRRIQPPDIFPMTSIVNESCNIECCVNSMLQIIQNMMVSQGLELELSMFRRTIISGQHLLI